jgi:hypothetical protein
MEWTHDWDDIWESDLVSIEKSWVDDPDTVLGAGPVDGLKVITLPTPGS